MKHSVRHIEGGVAVLELEGNLNMVSAAAVRDAIGSLVAEGRSRIVVDLAGVPFLDSSGLGALISGLKTTRDAGGDLRLAAVGEQVRLVLSLTNMERIFTPSSAPELAFADV